MTPRLHQATRRNNTEPSPFVSRALTAFILALVPAGLSAPAEEPVHAPERQRAPNIVLILADDLGYTDLGCYGGEIATPNIDALARGGVRFTQFYNSARCCPSRASLLTGLYPSQAGIGDFTTARPDPARGPGYLGRLNDQCVTLAEVLGYAGYACYYVGKWHVHPETGPIRRGFHEFYGYTNDHSHDQYDAEYYVRLPKGRKKEIDPPRGEFYATDVFNAYALEFIRQGQRSGKPWLLFLGHSSPHFPVQAPARRADKYDAIYLRGWDVLRQERYDRMRRLGLIDGERWKLTPRSIVPVDREDIANGFPGQQNPPWNSLDEERQRDLARRMAVFAAMVEAVDQGVGRIVDHLQSTGDFDNTLILFLSDNGACYEWGPFGFDGISRRGANTLHAGNDLRKIGGPGTHHSYGSAWANLGNTPLRLYKHFTHEGGICAPFVAHWPRGIGRPDRWIHEPAHVMDILPTIVAATGASYPAAHQGHPITPMEGANLLPVMRGQRLAERSIGFDHEGAHALRQGDWKLVWSKRMPHAIKWELYNLAEDRCETNDLADRCPERVAAMAAEWERWARRVHVIHEPEHVAPESDSQLDARQPRQPRGRQDRTPAPATQSAARTVVISLDDAAVGPGGFAAEEIRREATEHGMTVVSSAAPSPAGAIHIALGVSPPTGPRSAPQSYRIRVTREDADRTISVSGADASGVMYGGLDVAEAIHTGRLASLSDSDHSPHIERRGIKLNIPLDLRTPTYTDPSDAAQANIPEMWSMDFWREFFDDMARHRFNILSLWSLHPFPSIVKVPEFPHVALDDVWRTREKLDDSFGSSGDNFVRPNMLANHEVVKRMTIDEKIQFWRDVMRLAKDRGVDVYWFTWNVFLYGAEGKDGITNDEGALRTIEYFRCSVRETIKTYPLLAGLGITAGESMAADIGGIGKEKWLWKTYGEGIRDGLKDTPDRRFRLIHRFHMTALSDIQREFAALPCTLDLSFKYAIAHMYSVPDPGMIKPVLPLLSPELRCWLTVRNDDIYSFRWADVDYARAFVKAIPGDDKIAGFYMGCDGYLWGRDFLTKDPGGPRPTVMRKQWLSFALWGRLAYEPDLPAAAFERLTAARFPGADVATLTAAWASASKTFPHITRFFWGDIDLKWFPEACLSNPQRHRGYYTVRHFIEGGAMPGAGVLNIMEWRDGLLASQRPQGVTPLDIAAALDDHAADALRTLPELRRAAVTPAPNAQEYAATLGDIEAMAHLGRYYAAKIRGACELAVFDKTGDARRQAAAARHLESALSHWKNYSTAYTRQYIQPVLYNRVGYVDIPILTDKAADDVRIARDWKPGTIDATTIKRSGTEAGFTK